ncbi:hypothetical protein BHM03_00038524 [Ensete ventricosum]|nr:hypothetical protein BHM03_00038524 [Ensete ventricosum]
MGKLVYEIKCEGEEDEEERGGPQHGLGLECGTSKDRWLCLYARTVGVARGAPSLVVTPVPHRSCRLPPRVLFRPSRLKVRLAPPLPSPPLYHVRGRAPPHVTASRNLTASIWLV